MNGSSGFELLKCFNVDQPCQSDELLRFKRQEFLSPLNNHFYSRNLVRKRWYMAFESVLSIRRKTEGLSAEVSSSPELLHSVLVEQHTRPISHISCFCSRCHTQTVDDGQLAPLVACQEHKDLRTT